MKIKSIKFISDYLSIETENSLSFYICTGRSLKKISFTLKEIGALKQFKKDELATMLEFSDEKIDLIFKKRKNYKPQDIITSYYSRTEIECDFCGYVNKYDTYSCNKCYSEIIHKHEHQI